VWSKNSNEMMSRSTRPHRGDIYDDRHDVGKTSYAYHQNHLTSSTPSSLPSYGMFSTRGAPPKNIFADRSAPIDSYSFNSNTMVQEGRNPDDVYSGTSSSRSHYTREHRQDDEYFSRVSAEMRAGHRRTQEELLPPRFSSPSPMSLPPSHRHNDNSSFANDEVHRLEKQLAMNESEINELKRNNIEKEIAMKNAHYKHLEEESAAKTSEINDLKHQLSSLKLTSDERLKTKLGQQESKLLKVFKFEMQKCKEEMQAEQTEEMEALQQELADAMNEIKFLKRGCEFVEHEAKVSAEGLEQVCQQNEEILAEMELLRNENKELSAENALLKERYDDVLHGKIECERVTKELRAELEEKTQWEGTVKKMEKEIQHLVDQNEVAKSHLDEVWEENEEFKRRCIQLEKEIDQLREENRVESQLNDKVKEQRDKMGDKVKDQQSEIEMLKEQNEALQMEMDDLKNELLHTLDMASIYQKTHEIKNDS
jgi:chromosome segregation ATPase